MSMLVFSISVLFLLIEWLLNISLMLCVVGFVGIVSEDRIGRLLSRLVCVVESIRLFCRFDVVVFRFSVGGVVVNMCIFSLVGVLWLLGLVFWIVL